MKESWRTLKLPLSPTAKQVVIPQNYFSSTSRSTSRGRGLRVSTPTPRIPVNISNSRPGSASGQRPSVNIQGLSQEQLRRIYIAKCTDLCIPENVNQEGRFYKYCEKFLKNRHFSLTEQELGPACARVIGEILQNSYNFCCVDLSTNHLSDSGILKLGDCLIKNPNLIHLDISSNELTPEGLRILIEKFSDSTSLISLDISSYNGLHRNRIGPVASESLCNILKFGPVLSYLEINEIGLTDAGLEWIIMGLDKNTVLLKLGIGGNNITSKNIEEFCKVISLTNLEEINLSGNKIGDEGSKWVADLLVGNDVTSKIKKLDISKNEITYKGCGSIFLALRYNSVLTHLNIESNPLGAHAGQSLHFLMDNNFTIVWFNLNNCELKNGGISHLSLGLAKNKSLTTLILSNNGCKDLGLTSLCEALQENKILVNLDLSYNILQDGSLIAGMLKENVGLENVNLKENKIKEFSGPLFAEATKLKLNLLRFNLEGNHINLKHLEEVKQNLKRNRDFFYRKKAPTIKQEIQKLQSGSKDIESIYTEINRKKLEKNLIVTKIEKFKETVEEIKNRKDERLIELTEEYKVCREKSLGLSTELNKLNFDVSKFRIFEEKTVREKEDDTAHIVAEIKQLEKKSNLYLEMQRREELALKRSTMNIIILQLKEELQNEEIYKDGVESTLNTLNKKMLILKANIDSLKYSDSFYEERKVISPQPFVRPTRKAELPIVRKERARSVTNKKYFVFSPRP